MSNDMKTRITQITLTPGELFHERAFTISVIDEGGGEFLEVKSLDTCQTIRVDDDEWPHLREAIDRMFGEIEKEGVEDGLWDDVPDDYDWEENPQGPPALADGWIPWDGGKCPLTDNVRVDLKWSNGDNDSSTFATYWRWEHLVGFPNIAAYRVVSEEEDDDENAD